jgi:hypothetical protein
MSQNNNPLIVIGMHRSGTSLLAEILRKVGVFMGARRGVHEEALFFFRKNQYIFRLAHADWDNPGPVKYLIRNQELRSELTELLEGALSSFKVIEYLGLARYLKAGSLSNMGEAWGWKDPKNSYTLPVWLDIFPEGRVIHICRNGVDVANSLRRREQTRRNRMHNPLFSCRCFELNGAFDLWAEYVGTCLAVTGSLPKDRVMLIRYEDFLKNPIGYIERIATFLEIQLDEVTITEAVKGVQADRAYVFLNDPELEQLYENKRSHPLMKELDYDSRVS